jgi:SAM-dependent methyltransferase
MSNNIDPKTVESFGNEWSHFNQMDMIDSESLKVFNEYFSIFPWKKLPEKAVGFDMGCGSGRWAHWVAQRVEHLNCIDPSDAIAVAKRNLIKHENITFHRASLDSHCLNHNSQDFGYSLGVLHHVPCTQKAIKSCVDLLKPGAPLLLYIYYSFENRSTWYRTIWRLSDLIRRIICIMPYKIKYLITDLIAFFVYWPLSTFSRILEKIGFDTSGIPLSYYRNHSFYTMRTDACDRFGTPLEKRYSKDQIKNMMEQANLININFSELAPFWCVVGYKKS